MHPQQADEISGTHPLATDILNGFVGLLPRRNHGEQLWSLIEEPVRTSALLRAANLEAAFLHNATVNALSGLSARGFGRLLSLLKQRRGSVSHPLNSRFLDSVLRPLGVAERDIRWTEWIRSNANHSFAELKHLEERWRDKVADHSPSDRLLAGWVMWMLTSTGRKLRDQATRTFLDRVF
jgi:hypothetical protein